MKVLNRWWLILLMCCFAAAGDAQQDTLRTAQYTYMLLDKQEDLMVLSVYLQMKPNQRIHTGIKPYRYDMFERIEWDLDTFQWEQGLFRRFPRNPALQPETARQYIPYKGTNRWVNLASEKLFNESLIYLTNNNPRSPERYNISVNPIFFLEMAPGDGDIPYYYMNGRGVWASGNFGKVSFYTMIGENQGRFPQLYNQYYNNARFAHGWGFRKGFKDRGHDFAMAMGEVNYTPNHYFSFTLGHGKHFWGEGHRSLILSDFALPFPFFKIETTLGSLKYINLWAVHADGTGGRGLDAFPNKYTAMHLLSWNVTPSWNLQFFEANVWSNDTTSNASGFNVHFLNPLIFYRTVELQAGFGGGNALAGLSSSYRLFPGFKVYGQFVLDDFKLSAFQQRGDGHWLNLYGMQLGAVYANHGPDLNYMIGLEWNRVNPFVYSHRSSATNYVHFNYPIAHPWGSGFQEVLTHGQIRYKRWIAEGFISAGVAGRDTSGINLGNNLASSYDDRPLGDLGYGIPTGNPATIVNAQLSLGYMINISTGMRFEVGARIRRERFELDGFFTPRPFDWYFVGLRTPLFNRYYDL